MKIFNKYIELLMALLIIVSSCDDKFNDINTDPDATTKVTPSLLANGLLLDITELGGAKWSIYDNELSKQICSGEHLTEYSYNILGRTGFGGYGMLTNCSKMVESATERDKNAYDGLAHFLKAYKLFYSSMEVGDIPYSEALQGEEGLIKPKYDTQKDVMKFILNDLDKSYELFSNAVDFAGDEFLGGNVAKWKKVVTAFEMKVLMHLSKKEADTDLNVKQRFSSIVSSREMMESNDDNFQMNYYDKAESIYPLNVVHNKHYIYVMLSSTIVDVCKETQDPRLFYYASPAQTKIDAGLTADNWDAYIGTDPSLPFEEVKAAFAQLNFCGLNRRYTHLATGEPIMRIGYPEQNFILAEAAVRGWISGDASIYYKKAIKGSMDFITAATPDEEQYHHGHPMTEEVKAEFLESPKIQLGTDKEENIEKILTQRYLASFLQHPYDPFYDYRRTGYPKLPINPETNLNPVKDQMPLRWMYPKSEYDYNKENVEEAVKRQYGGDDDVNKPMWIIQ